MFFVVIGENLNYTTLFRRQLVSIGLYKNNLVVKLLNNLYDYYLYNTA